MAGAGDPHIDHLRYGAWPSAYVFTRQLVSVTGTTQALRQCGAVAGAFVVKKIMHRHVL